MQRLVEGIHYFQKIDVPSHRQLFEGLSQGQRPMACFITCSDSRIDPNRITNTNPGELFIVRNAGNIVPPHGTSNNSEAAAVEFAIAKLGIQDIIVCGHNHCGAMDGLMQPAGLAGMPAVRSWLRHAAATRHIIQSSYSHLTGEAMLTAAAEENVLVQMEHLHTLPSVAVGLNRGEVRLHGWMYKLETGEVFAYHPLQRQFLPIELAAQPVGS